MESIYKLLYFASFITIYNDFNNFFLMALFTKKKGKFNDKTLQGANNLKNRYTLELKITNLLLFRLLLFQCRL